METAEEITSESLNAFGDLAILIANVQDPSYKIINEISQMEKIIRNFCEIGEHIIVEFSNSMHFDSLAGIYRKNDFLYIPKYSEKQVTEHYSSKFLKFAPEKMLINVSENPEYNYVVIQTKGIRNVQGNNIECEEGIKQITDLKGNELKPLKNKEIYHIFLAMYKPGRVLLHPRGSIFTTTEKGYYFRKRN